MPRNPSEIQRLIEEYCHLVKAILDRKPTAVGIYDKGLKSALEIILRELRQLEKQLEFESFPYNSKEFKSSAVSRMREFGCV